MATKQTKNQAKSTKLDDWQKIRITYYVLIFVALLGCLAMTGLAITKFYAIEMHINGIEKQVEQNAADTKALIEHYPQFIQLTYDTFDGMIEYQRSIDLRLRVLENKSQNK